MKIRAIALPTGAELLWIRVGKYLDPVFGRHPDETVESIDPAKSGYAITTVRKRDGRSWSYVVDQLFVRRLETIVGDAGSL